jgi:hypothetical protein
VWIKTVVESEAQGETAELYDWARTIFNGRVPDMVKVLSLRPKVARAKEMLRQSLIGNASSLGAKRADMISVVVSGLNGCRF